MAQVRPADVAIVGFGPVGAMLAGLLGRRGLDGVVVEREMDVFALPRAAHIDPTGLRALQDLGCLDRVPPDMMLNPGLHFVTADRQLLVQLPSPYCDPARPHTAIPLPNHRYRFELMLIPGEDPAEVQPPDRVFEILRHHLPRRAAEVERASVYTFHGLLAERFRSGRVLIAGDAAHQMPPFLGQGMCSGLRDATNLAWKHDHVISRGGPAALIDTYGDERRPHVGAIIEAAVDFGHVICTTDPAAAPERDPRTLSHRAPPAGRPLFGLPHLPPGALVC